jgi:uncharacterized protein (TIGR00251 family)
VPGWHRFDADRNVLCIRLHVQPNARSTEIAGKHGERLKVRVAAPALQGRANTLLIEFLRKTMDVPASRVTITQGARGRAKTVEILAPGDTALHVIEDWDRT